MAGLVLAVLAVAVAGAPTAWRLRTHPLDGPGIVAAAIVVTFGLTALAWLGTPINPAPGVDRQDIAEALLLVAAGLVAFGIGARLVSRPAATAMPQVAATALPSVRALGITYAVTASATVAALAAGRYGYLSDPNAASTGTTQITSLGGALAGVTVLVTVVAAFAVRSRPYWLLLAAVVGVQCAIGFVAGVKGESVTPVIYVALAYVAWRRRIPWRWVIGAVAVVLLLLLPTNRAYREALRGPGNPVSAVWKVVSRPANYRPDLSAKRGLDYFVDRFRQIDHVALIVSRTPSQYPFADGRRYLELPFVAVVPRALWPGKPVLDDSAQFSHTYWQIPRGVQTATQITLPGDLYRNWGAAGIVAGMFIWGLLTGLWSRACLGRASPRLIAVHLFALLTVFGYVEADLPTNLATAARTVPIVAIAAFLILPGQGGSEPGARRGLRWLRRHAGSPRFARSA
ncbi:MAG: hypothetical protein QOG68_276 [Solirubrobacteraceae bacterium]|nr:hypothetical protein [Solirubrobacteraceae bacterium]